jgi:hypothetical protein
VDEAQFVVNDPRVSRLHARIAGASGEIALRRDECVLHGSGEIGLGAPLSDFSAPTISFNTTGGNVQLARRETR